MNIKINGKWVTDVIRVAVEACREDENVQLTILTRALVFAAKTLGVEKDAIIDAVSTAYDKEEVKKPS